MSSVEEKFLEIPLSEIGEGYARLRLIHPQSDARMMDSVGKFGQIFPVAVAKLGRYELIDGFKRVRALRRLGFEHVSAKVLELSVHGLKAAMMYLNWERGPISDLEEGMILHSLCREDGLSQVEVAALVGRHKSWVCRRISLIERLCDEALEHMRLGLIHAGIGRELCRLPRGNQEAALRTILKYRFCSRESARLVSLLLERPRWDRQNILNFPQGILSERTPMGRPARGSSPTASLLTDKLLDVKRLFLSIVNQYSEEALLRFTMEEWAPICSALQGIEETFYRFKHQIDAIPTRTDGQ